jgi:hypothetical protein
LIILIIFGEEYKLYCENKILRNYTDCHNHQKKTMIISLNSIDQLASLLDAQCFLWGRKA